MYYLQNTMNCNYNGNFEKCVQYSLLSQQILQQLSGTPSAKAYPSSQGVSAFEKLIPKEVEIVDFKALRDRLAKIQNGLMLGTAVVPLKMLISTL